MPVLDELLRFAKSVVDRIYRGYEVVSTADQVSDIVDTIGIPGLIFVIAVVVGVVSLYSWSKEESNQKRGGFRDLVGAALLGGVLLAGALLTDPEEAARAQARERERKRRIRHAASGVAMGVLLAVGLLAFLVGLASWLLYLLLMGLFIVALVVFINTRY